MSENAFASFSDWKQHGWKIAKEHSDHQWRIADWLIAGEDFGDQNPYDVAQEITGYARLTLQNWASVARHASIRIEALSFGHHQLVAALEPTEQKEWLERAAAEKWSVKTLTEKIQDAHAASVNVDESEPADSEPPAKKKGPRKQLAPDEFHKALRFVPSNELADLSYLAAARGTTKEELVAYAIRQLNASAVDEIARQKEMEMSNLANRGTIHRRLEEHRRQKIREANARALAASLKEDARHRELQEQRAALEKEISSRTEDEQCARDEALQLVKEAEAALSWANEQLQIAKDANELVRIEDPENEGALKIAMEHIQQAEQQISERQVALNDACAKFKPLDEALKVARENALKAIQQERQVADADITPENVDQTTKEAA